MKIQRMIQKCTLKVKHECLKNWDSLQETDNDSARFCSTCEKNVYLCTTDEETIQRAKNGDCIAREIPDRSELPMDFMGKVDVVYEDTEEQTKALELASRESGIFEAINRLNPSKYCSNCGYPTSEWSKSCKVCGKIFTDAKVYKNT